MKLLNFLGLKKPMVSYYEHALQKGEAILQRIEAGERDVYKRQSVSWSRIWPASSTPASSCARSACATRAR